MKPLIVIVGVTGSGKSALAMELAEQFGGEIICADSRTVYQGMDIGTAKPSAADRARIPHHLLDVVTPDESFSAADFKTAALRAIDDVSSRGTLPIMVGGTGLYVDAVLYDFSFREPADPTLREELMQLSIVELQERVLAAGLQLPNNTMNPRHLMRMLETGGTPAERKPLRKNTLVIGLDPGTDVLRTRIADRVEAMFADGFVDEARRLAGQYGWDAEALQAPGYKAVREYLSGACSLDTAKAVFVRNDLQYAKRQRTWFKRNKSIHWFTNIGEMNSIVDIVTTFLNKD